MLTPPARWCLLEGTILIGWLDDHIIVLHHHELEKLVPASQHLLSLLYTVVVEILHGSLWVLGIKLLSLLLNTCLSSEIAVVQAITNLLQGWEHQAVTRINHIAGHIANPVSVLLAEMHRINTRSIIALRTLGHRAIYWSERSHIGIVVGKPEHAANLSWQP